VAWYNAKIVSYAYVVFLCLCGLIPVTIRTVLKTLSHAALCVGVTIVHGDV